MAVSSEIQAILEFLQKNGFTEAETAFKQDISEKKRDLKLFDYEKFEFPMSPPPPPPVKIGLFYPSSSSNSDSSSDFMSIGSFNTDASTVGFTNPYGIRTGSRIKSEASSLDDFGTARDYRDIDILNNGYWYDEKDEDYLKHSSFGKAEFLGSPPEDKFVTTSEVEGRYEQTMSGFHSETSIVCLDKSCPLYNMPMNYDHDLKLQSFYNLDQTIRSSKKGGEVELECFDESNNRSIRLCDCCTKLKECQGVNINDCRKLDALSVTQLRKVGSGHSDYDWKDEKEGSFRHRKDILDTEDLRHEAELQLAVVENSSTSIGYDEYEREDIGETVDELHDPVTAGEGEECGTPNELQMYESREEEYEVFNLRIVHRKNRTGFEANKDLPIVLNTTLAGRYYVTEYLGSAAFSKVVQAHDLHTGVDVCLKIIKNDKDFFDQSLDEIKLLKFVNKHDPGDTRHILRLYDYFYHQEHLFIVCELLRANLYEFLKYNQESGGEPYFTLPRLQVITRQILEALEYLHNLGIIHCDLKPENILIKSYSRSEVKVIDLGSSCFQTDNLCLYIQSRSYRAPEVILGHPYDQRIDIWSLGCILAELCSGEVLFPNDAVVTLLERMIAMFGPIDMEMLVKGQETHKYFTKDYEYLYHINEETSELQYVIPEESSLENFVKSSDDEFTEFLKYLLEMNPMRRPTASEALQHPWLSQVYDS